MEGEALECHEGLIYFALHKLTNGRLFLGAGTGYDSEGGGGQLQSQRDHAAYARCANEAQFCLVATPQR